MAIQQKTRRFTLKNAIGTLAESISSHWKPALVAAPLIGTALFLASGTQAQTSGSATPTVTTSANGTVAPIASPEAARRKGPKVKVKDATGRVANPTQTGEPTADAPVAQPTERRRKGPKVRDDPVLDTSRTGRPKERDPTPTNDRVANPTPAPATEPTGRRRKGPKGDHDHGRTSKTPLIIGALGAATVLALVVSSGNDRPASP